MYKQVSILSFAVLLLVLFLGPLCYSASEKPYRIWSAGFYDKTVATNVNFKDSKLAKDTLYLDSISSYLFAILTGRLGIYTSLDAWNFHQKYIFVEEFRNQYFYSNYPGINAVHLLLVKMNLIGDEYLKNSKFQLPLIGGNYAPTIKTFIQLTTEYDKLVLVDFFKHNSSNQEIKTARNFLDSYTKSNAITLQATDPQLIALFNQCKAYFHHTFLNGSTILSSPSDGVCLELFKAFSERPPLFTAKYLFTSNISSNQSCPRYLSSE